jgi:3-deoxy-D-manno-octulosonic-acid transferase
VLGSIEAIGARSAEDAVRLGMLGAPPERVRVVGDLKLDRDAPSEPSESLRAALGPGPLFVAGSTHSGEEEIVMSAWDTLRSGVAPQLRLILAPRHAERAPGVLHLARERGLRASLRTEGGSGADVVVLDTLGELSSVYHLADLVFCGGSLVPVGGHNLLEPVRAGRVVVCGSHLENQRNQADLLRPLGVLHEAGSAAEFCAILGRIWMDPERNRPAREAADTLAQHRGAAQRCVALVLELLEEDGAIA